MLSIFMLRRLNILPVNDLGVQNGLIKWYLGYQIKKEKVEDEKIKEDMSIGKVEVEKVEEKDKEKENKVRIPKAALDMGLNEAEIKKRIKKRLK